jgi:hypothetical protein
VFLLSLFLKFLVPLLHKCIEHLLTSSRFAEHWDFENESASFKNFNGAKVVDMRSSELTNWRVTKGNVELIGSGYFKAQNGDYCVDLTGRTPGRIEQVRKQHREVLRLLFWRAWMQGF